MKLQVILLLIGQLYTLKVYTPTGTNPIQQTSVPASAATCGLPAPTSAGTVLNPNYVVFDDPAAVGKVCRIPLTAFFGGLPIGNYVGKLSITNDVTKLESSQAISNEFITTGCPSETESEWKWRVFLSLLAGRLLPCFR